MNINDQIEKLRQLAEGVQPEPEPEEPEAVQLTVEEIISNWDRLFEDGDSGDAEPTETLPDTPAEPAASDDGKDDKPAESDDGSTEVSDNDAPEVPAPESSGEGSEPAGDSAGDEPPKLDDPDDQTDPEAAGSVLDEIAEKIHLSNPEMELLTGLIDSETDAITDYSGALNETKNKYARKLYTEILSDEAKHLAQLRYLKSMADDSGYVPKDQEAIQELSKTLESIVGRLDVVDELKAKIDTIFDPTDTL